MTLYILSGPAELDLVEILLYLERQSPAAALRVETLLIEEMDALATLPVRYRSRPPLVPAPYRVHVAGSYLLIYNPDTKPLSVLRILHGKRDLDAILRDLHE